MNIYHKYRFLYLLAGGIGALSITQNTIAAEKDNATALELSTVEVISSTPIPGIGQPIDKYAGNIQTVNTEDLEKQNATDLSETLARNIGSVDINTVQNNPFQNDIHYRGFLASPLVGTAIGVSSYIDGVRVNEAFGDTVNWDLVPDFALNSVSIIPGSNPLFGLNTLGGALSVQTKSGLTFQGTSIGLSSGSADRISGTWRQKKRYELVYRC